LVWGKIQLVSGLDLEGLIPSIDVWHHAINAKPSRGVDIADQLISLNASSRVFPLQECA
jgi:hypothetical protein